MPAPDGGDDFIGIGDPLEGFGLSVVIVEEAVDGGLKIDERTEDATLRSRPACTTSLPTPRSSSAFQIPGL
jgi:hypothetical protein